MVNAATRIDDLRVRIESTVRDLADPSRGYALLDFPSYSNVGDSLIWLGELAFFDAFVHRPPAYVCTIWDFDPALLARRLPDGPIYLSGGGNFGDLWPRFQQFRHAVLTAFPGRRIVQLPQTVQFDTREMLEQTRAAIHTHGNFTMLVRDEESLRIVREQLECDVALCPDMAFCLGPQGRPAPPTVDILALLRTDKEGNGADPALLRQQGVTVVDWIQREPELSLKERVQKKLRSVMPGGDGNNKPFARKARAEMARGMALLGQGSVVMTDRLHGHILSILMGLPHVIMDNRHGKVSRFASCWTSGVDNVVQAIDHQDGLARGRALLQQSPGK
jgi:pyruvyl transferase EpsO